MFNQGFVTNMEILLEVLPSTAYFTFYYTLLLFKLNLYNIVVVCWNMTCPQQF